MINYKFCITQFNVTVKDQGTDWVVRDISWIYSGENADGIYASTSGTTQLTYDPNSVGFVPINQVTNELLTTWLLDTLGGAFLQHLQASIEGSIYRNATIVGGVTAMVTWLPLPGPAAVQVDTDILNAYLSG
jgi:hypothetical protein